MAQVVWTEPALDDLEVIATYIALDKPGAANCLVQRVVAQVEKLALFPSAGGRPRELTGTPYRQLVVRPLRIFYRVEGELIFIVYVLRGEQLFSLLDLQGR